VAATVYSSSPGASTRNLPVITPRAVTLSSVQFIAQVSKLILYVIEHMLDHVMKPTSLHLYTDRFTELQRNLEPVHIPSVRCVMGSCTLTCAPCCAHGRTPLDKACACHVLSTKRLSTHPLHNHRFRPDCHGHGCPSRPTCTTAATPGASADATSLPHPLTRPILAPPEASMLLISTDRSDRQACASAACQGTTRSMCQEPRGRTLLILQLLSSALDQAVFAAGMLS